MGSSDLIVVDAQIHVWKASTPERPWPADAIEPQRAEPLEVPEVLRRMDAAGVSGALILGPTWEGSRNDYVLETAAAQPARFGGICRFPASDPAEVEQLAHWREVEGMRAIRLSLNRGDVDSMVADAVDSGFFATAQACGIPICVYAPGRYALYQRLAEDFPGLKVTVDHAAVDSDELPLPEAVKPLLALARHPGIAVKVSALPCFVRETYPFPSIAEAVYRLVEAFGPERVFFGSDLSRLPVPYPQLVDVFVNHLPRLDHEERALVAGRALAAWIGWPEVLGGGTAS
ncbi:amidohydrolase family protein [Dactylosporangium sp. AC04546]|uniref:amidohydrolase family protein n=1 Tax=Dactylosporangium sp. AC04546 TaxID=2862460 RepID=UPI001EE09DD6|nr:amidohydrolase family protein [Dactylosporangium sp. AC04546]WVK80775.1 amidohydrolase family protein [Dactylosporangium sp. AC04546]